ncbi:helix-turn-helix domain-containing protein [uncultured Mitsuokella sp.]|uniref:helix-turn-helix domain-containing protein n=1 Tax=uncultured Mitsuokella sp. TaxID=453120 RepID=UPI0026DD94AE|nr:helix-turn-helix transcriptional regulator [uncultured Mitsuokella sp.]
MALRDNLKRLREQQGISGKEFANQLDLNYSTYMTYESTNPQKARWPNEETLLKIATALHTSTDDLLGYRVDPYERAESMLQSIGVVVTHDAGNVRLEVPADIYDYLSRQSKMFLENLVMHAMAGQQQSVEIVMPEETFHDCVDKAVEPATDESQKVFFNTFMDTFLARIQWYHYEQELRTAYQKDHPLTPFLGHDPFPTGKEPDKADSPRADQAKEKAADPKANGKHKKD